jgi:hypothetical protein
VEDRLAVLSQTRPWALSEDALLAGFDALHALVTEAQAALVRFVREIEVRKTAAAHSASSAAVWYRNRHRVAIRSTHRLSASPSGSPPPRRCWVRRWPVGR